VTITVNCYTSGDKWLNQIEMTQQLYAIDKFDTVIVHMQHEGISLKASGILKVIDQWVIATGRDPTTVKIDTSNQFEKIPYQYDNPVLKLTHFFTKTGAPYFCDARPLTLTGKLFGLFMQRYTEDRATMAQDILDHYQEHCLISIQQNHKLSSGSRGTWWPEHIYNIGSIDNTTIDDHYGPSPTANSSLLTFYNQFQIEIIAETVTRGETFFPTEKTARPIIGCRPFLLFGPVGFLDNLKQTGFKTFSDLWDENYDQYEGVERWIRMKLVMDAIVQDGYNCNLAQDIVKYNYQHFYNFLQTTT
jgi:hypothetical protein